ncbi:MAG: sulfotransferase domain-containing protein [Flavobacteriales bacterium]|nr:sulfotransferase domain-containing protein [Flavobacteriales bacterium]
MKLAVIAGMPRAGTTFMYLNLKDHPSIASSAVKEINYFSFNFGRGFSWFNSLFGGSTTNQVRLDVSPSYFFDLEASERMNEFDGDVKLIIGVRDPKSWLESFYQQISNHLIRKLDWEAFQKGHDWSIEGNMCHLDFKDGFLQRYLDHWKTNYKGEILIYRYDHFKENPLDVLQAIESFLEIPSHFKEETFSNVIVNSSSRKNNKLLTILMNIGWLKSLIFKLIPSSFVEKARDQVIKNSNLTKPKQEVKKSFIHTESRDEDEKYYSALKGLEIVK